MLKYITRWRFKGGLDDLRKARHYLDVYLEHLEKLEAQFTADEIAERAMLAELDVVPGNCGLTD